MVQQGRCVRRCIMQLPYSLLVYGIACQLRLHIPTYLLHTLATATVSVENGCLIGRFFFGLGLCVSAIVPGKLISLSLCLSPSSSSGSISGLFPLYLWRGWNFRFARD